MECCGPNWYVASRFEEATYLTVSFPAVPHRAMEDDIHDGYFIPKGSLIIPNIWYVMSSLTFSGNSKSLKQETYP